MRVSFAGGSEEVDESNVAAFLRRCAQNLPGDDKRDAEMWGDAAAVRVVVDSAGTSLRAAAVRAIEQLFEEGRGDQLRLAQLVVPPEEVSVRALERAADREDLTPEERARVVDSLARALATQPAAWRSSLRRFVGAPGWEPMIGALIVADHDWFVSHLVQVLGTDPDRAAYALHSGILHFRREQVVELRRELEDGGLSIPWNVRAALLAYLDEDVSQRQSGS